MTHVPLEPLTALAAAWDALDPALDEDHPGSAADFADELRAVINTAQSATDPAGPAEPVMGPGHSLSEPPPYPVPSLVGAPTENGIDAALRPGFKTDVIWTQGVRDGWMLAVETLKAGADSMTCPDPECAHLSEWECAALLFETMAPYRTW